MEVKLLSGALGAEIQGIDLTDTSDKNFDNPAWLHRPKDQLRIFMAESLKFERFIPITTLIADYHPPLGDG